MTMLIKKGFATLAITSILLVIALGYSLSSYRSIYYQIKVANNELEARQVHWRAEGGLECAFAKIMLDQDITKLSESVSANYFKNTCATPMSLYEVKTKNTGGSDYLISAQSYVSYGRHLKKSISVDDGSGQGALQSEASIKLISDNTIAIDPDVTSIPLVNGKFECVAMRFKESVIYVNNVSGSKLVTEDPGQTPAGFTECNEQTNLSSDSTINSSESGLFLSDYKYDPDIDTFYNYFGMENTPANLNAIKADYHHITMTPSSDCDVEVSSAFASGKTKVWVTGDCIIYPSLLVQDGSGSIIAKSLVVENGIFLSSGSTVFDGSFYHMVDMSIFDDPNTPSADLDLLPAHWNLATSTVPGVSPLVESNSVYIDNGSFFPKGGISFDYPGGLSTIKGSMNLDFLSHYNPHPDSLKISWKQGSWNDL